MGILSVVFAVGNFAPGLLSVLGCVGAAAALLALLAGVLGLRATRKLDGQGRGWALIGLSLGGLGLLVFIAVMGSAALSAIRDAEVLLTPQPPQVFQGGDLTLTDPGGWQVVDMSQQDFCKQPGVECLIAISAPSGEGSNLNLMRFSLDQEATVEQLEQEAWAKFESSTADVTMVSRAAIEVGVVCHDIVNKIKRLSLTTS